MVKVLQGLNLENKTSVIEINAIKTDNLEKLLQLIHSFHPIFLEEYKYEENTLKIYSNLPFLWEELGKVLEQDLPYNSNDDKE